MDIVKENEKQIENDLSKQMSLSQCQSKKKKNALQTPIRPKSKEEPKTQQINSVKKKNRRANGANFPIIFRHK